MHTENEAREKWCPFARTLHREVFQENTRQKKEQLGLESVNRLSTGLGPFSCCIASECMAWRSGGPAWRDRESGILFAAPPKQGESDKVQVGYCGLAGKP